MPRGGHNGIWRPTPKDIFKSRWKRWYKRSYLSRSGDNDYANNAVDRRPTPQDASKKLHLPDGTGSLWRLNTHSFGEKDPQDMERGGPGRSRFAAYQMYKDNRDTYLKPFSNAQSPMWAETVIRCLDRERHGSHSGESFGQSSASWEPDSDSVSYLTAAIRSAKEEAASRFLSAPNSHNVDSDYEVQSYEVQTATPRSPPEKKEVVRPLPGPYLVRRLYGLCDEYELVWRKGQRPLEPREDENEGTRGRFPYVDEQHSALGDLNLSDILRVNHRIKSRRHPRWKEAVYLFKKARAQYLIRRQVCKDEAKARQGVMKQVLQ